MKFFISSLLVLQIGLSSLRSEASLLCSEVFPTISVVDSSSNSQKNQTEPVETFQELSVLRDDFKPAEKISPETSRALKIFKKLLVFPLPVIPLYKAFSNKERRYFVFFETPLINLANTMVGTTLYRSMFPTEASFLRQFLDSYISYMPKDIIASQIATDKDFTARERYWINYLYTITFYSLVTTMTSKTLPHIVEVLQHPASATPMDIQSASYGMGLIGFSIIYPLFTQVVQTTLLKPFLFERFLQSSDLESISKDSFETIERKYNSEVSAIHKKISMIQAAPNHQSNQTIIQLSKDKSYLEDRYLWKKWITKGLDAGDKVPLFNIRLQKPLPKVSVKFHYLSKVIVSSIVAATMIVTYFLARDHMIGDKPENPQFATKYIESILKNHELDNVSFHNTTEQDLRGVINEIQE